MKLLCGDVSKAAAKKKKRRSHDWTGEVVRGKTDKYQVGGRVGSGTFADCYEGKGCLGKRVCMKFEERSSRRLEAEYRVLSKLSGSGVNPDAIDLIQLSRANVLVLELLGPSLDALTKKGTGKFSVGTVCLIAAQIMDCIKHVHSNGFLHRDIKPHNFVIGNAENRNRIYIIDFGLVKPYIVDGHHVSYKTDKPFIGTARYVSINAHKGIEQGRRDDMESLAYMFFFFLRGKVPWQGLGSKLEKARRLELICDIKSTTSAASLCEGFPAQFATYLTYCKNLPFKACPDYRRLKEMFLSLADTTAPPDWERSGLAQQLCDDLEARTSATFEKAASASASVPTTP